MEVGICSEFPALHLCIFRPAWCVMTFSPCSILYQRGVYPPESFKQHKQYNLSMMVTTDTGLTTYLINVLANMSGEGDAHSCRKRTG